MAKERFMDEIEADVRKTSLYNENTTDVLVEVGRYAAGEMRDKLIASVVAMLDTVNPNAFPNTESYIGFLKQSVKDLKYEEV